MRNENNINNGLNGSDSHKPKLNKLEEIVRFINEQILLRSDEINALQKSKQPLEQTGETGIIQLSPVTNPDNPKKFNHNLIHYPGYPKDGDIMEKIYFLESTTNRFWKMSEMKDRLREAEGNNWNSYQDDNFRKVLNEKVRQGKIKQLMYNNSKKQCYYSTRDEWLESIEIEGLKYHKVIGEHSPEPENLKNLTEDQLDIKKITWKGI